MKITLNNLPGYKEEMTAEEKLALVLGHDFDVVDKKVFDNASSDLAKFKRESGEKIAAAATEKATLENRVKELETTIGAVTRENTVNKYKAKYLALGYDEENAAKAADALTDGDTETLFTIQQEAVEAAKNNAIADKLRSMGTPASGSPQGQQIYTREQIKGMTADEINKNWDAISKSLSNS